jgi:hypothetical protein
VDTPSGKVAEKTSSYDLSIFSSGANSQVAEIVAAVSEGSSPSIGELVLVCSKRSLRWLRKLVDSLGAKVKRHC